MKGLWRLKEDLPGTGAIKGSTRKPFPQPCNEVFLPGRTGQKQTVRREEGTRPVGL